MRQLVLRIGVNIAVVLLLLVFEDIWITHPLGVMLPTLILFLLNTFLPFLLIRSALPQTTLAFAVVTVLLNAMVIVLCDLFVPGFYAQGLWTVIAAAVIMTLTNFVLHLLIISFDVSPHR